MPARSQFLSHLPVLCHSCGSEFNAVVPHAEIDIIDGIHQEAVLVFFLRDKKITLDGIIRHDARTGDPLEKSHRRHAFVEKFGRWLNFI